MAVTLFSFNFVLQNSFIVRLTGKFVLKVIAKDPNRH